MTPDDARTEQARTIVDANQYMVLGTADASGTPWASPVWFAHHDYREFVWVSSPEVRHSRNIAERPQIGIVIFDSSVPIGADRTFSSAELEPSFFRAFLQNGFESPDRLEPIRTLKGPLRVYMRSQDDRGRAIDDATLQSTEQILREIVTVWSGGTFGVTPLVTETAGSTMVRAAVGRLSHLWVAPVKVYDATLLKMSPALTAALLATRATSRITTCRPAGRSPTAQVSACPA